MNKAFAALSDQNTTALTKCTHTHTHTHAHTHSN